MDFLSPVAARARRVSAERVRLQLTQDELAREGADRMAEEMMCMTPTSGSEYEADTMRQGLMTPPGGQGRGRRGEALGSPPPARLVAATIKPLELPKFVKEAVPAIASVRSLLSDTLEPLAPTGMRRNARSFDVGERAELGPQGPLDGLHHEGHVRHHHGKRRSSVVGREDTGTGAPPRGPPRPGARHRRSMSMESADTLAAAAAAASGGFLERRGHGSATPSRRSRRETAAITSPEEVRSTMEAAASHHSPAPASPLTTIAEALHAGQFPEPARNHRQAETHGRPPVHAHWGHTGYVSDAQSSGIESDVVEEGRIWQVTQMLAGASVSDVIRGVVRLCNMRGGSFSLMSPYVPGTPGMSSGPQSNSDTDAATHGRRGTSTLLPLAPGAKAQIMQGLHPGTVLVPKGIDEDALGVDIIQAAARPPEAVAGGLHAAPAGKTDMYITRDGPVSRPSGSSVPTGGVSTSSMTPRGSRGQPPHMARLTSPVSPPGLPPRGTMSPASPIGSPPQQALPSMFGLRVLEEGEPDFDFPELDRNAKIESLGERDFALCLTKAQCHVLDIRVQPTKSTRGAAILRISFRRPKRLRSLDSSASAAAFSSLSSPGANIRGSMLAVQPAAAPLSLDDSDTDTVDHVDNVQHRVPAVASPTGMHSTRSRGRKDRAHTRGNRSARHLRESSSNEDDQEDISFDEWYRREYGSGDANASDTKAEASIGSGQVLGSSAAGGAAPSGPAENAPSEAGVGGATADAAGTSARSANADKSLLSFPFRWFSGDQERAPKSTGRTAHVSGTPTGAKSRRHAANSAVHGAAEADEYEGDVDESATKSKPPKAVPPSTATTTSWGESMLRTPRAFFGGAFRRFTTGPPATGITPTAATPVSASGVPPKVPAAKCASMHDTREGHADISTAEVVHASQATGVVEARARPLADETTAAAPAVGPKTVQATPRRGIFASLLSSLPSSGSTPPSKPAVTAVDADGASVAMAAINSTAPGTQAADSDEVVIPERTTLAAEMVEPPSVGAPPQDSPGDKARLPEQAVAPAAGVSSLFASLFSRRPTAPSGPSSPGAPGTGADRPAISTGGDAPHETGDGGELPSVDALAAGDDASAQTATIADAQRKTGSDECAPVVHADGQVVDHDTARGE